MSRRPLPALVPEAESVVALKLAMRCASVAEFAERYWRLVKGDRILIASKQGREVGTAIRFTLTLSDGAEVLSGEGKVVRVREAPGKAHWLEVAFLPANAMSERYVAMLGELRAANGQEEQEFEEELPTVPTDRSAHKALEEWDEKNPTIPIDRKRLAKTLGPPPLPADVAREQKEWDEEVDGFMADPLAVWQSLPTGRILKLCQGELAVGQAPALPSILVEPDPVIVGTQLPQLPPTGQFDLPPVRLMEPERKSGLVLGLVLLGVVLAVFVAGWLLLR